MFMCVCVCKCLPLPNWLKINCIEAIAGNTADTQTTIIANETVCMLPPLISLSMYSFICTYVCMCLSIMEINIFVIRRYNYDQMENKVFQYFSNIIQISITLDNCV